MDIHHIVVGLELGKLSDQAVVRAMSLARAFGARLHVVHGAGIDESGSAARRQALEARSARALAQAHAAARGKLELTVEDPVYAEMPLDDYLHVSPRSGAEALLEFAREHGADLIVIGAHRHRKVLDFGGTGRAVLAKSPCPVWVEPAEARRFERLLVPVDLSPSTATVLAAARNLAARFEVPVRVLHAFVPPLMGYDPVLGGEVAPGYTIERLRATEHDVLRADVARHDWGTLPVEVDFVDGEPAHEIVRRAGPADLIVMGTHGHTGFSRAVLGSVAYRVLKHGSGPMLVIPQRVELYLDSAKR